MHRFKINIDNSIEFSIISESNLFDLEYEFSLDKNLDNSNFNLLRTNFTINNFVTSFEFLEEDNIIGNKSYITNKSKLAFDKNNFISFETSKNLDKNITDYYNLIYEYNKTMQHFTRASS